MEKLLFMFVIAGLLAAQAASAQSDRQLYVTREDCRNLVAHHPDAGAAYQPGVDVHGNYVAPADLPGNNDLKLPDKITFDLRLDPMTYAPSSGAPPGAFDNSFATLGHVEVDLLSGNVKFNGHVLDDDQTRIVTEACRKAGYH